ncbi:MAG: hypothetical protein J5501_06930 [Ruminococcus sp.]|nr:hypothetical protein [Ruminococcus sp.]
MWKMKLRHPFGGYSIYILIASTAATGFGAMLGLIFRSISLIVVMVLLGLILPWITTLLYQNCRKDVLKKIRSAGEPAWRELEPYEYEELLAQQVKKRSPPVILSAMQAVVIPLLVLCAFSVKTLVTAFFILEVVPTAIWLMFSMKTMLTSGKWELLDASARIAEIPIDSSYIVSRRSSSGKDYMRFYVYYLSSGRYVADEEQVYSGSVVKIVRWNGSLIYLRRKSGTT